jgi:hypothetical protein
MPKWPTAELLSCNEMLIRTLSVHGTRIQDPKVPSCPHHHEISHAPINKSLTNRNPSDFHRSTQWKLYSLCVHMTLSPLIIGGASVIDLRNSEMRQAQ